MDHPCNYLGTIFGGSLYGALDPIYMIMLIKTLGPRNAAGQFHAMCEKLLSVRRRKGTTSMEEA